MVMAQLLWSIVRFLIYYMSWCYALTIFTATAFLPVVEAAYNSVAARGKFVFVGANMDPEYKLPIQIGTHMMNGTQLLGCCEGDSVPAEVSGFELEPYRLLALMLHLVHPQTDRLLSRRQVADRQDR